MKAYSDLARNIAAARNKRHFTVIRVADRTGVGEETVRRWESGKTSPSAVSLARLADALGVSTDDLLGRTPAGR